MSENWWIEKDKAYFCGTRISALFCVDLNSLQCEIVSWIPGNDKFDFFMNPYCMKYKDSIICLPGNGNKIWSYNLSQAVWEETEIENTGQLLTFMGRYSQADGRVWLSEYDTGKILQVNTEKKTVEKKYHLSKGEQKVYYGEYVIVQNRLYIVGGAQVCCIDIGDEEITVYKIPDIKTDLQTICYDGVNFWLSGCCKEIYVWNPQHGLVNVLTKFPENFGIYHFHEAADIDYTFFSYTVEENSFFGYSFPLGKNIWYLPTQSNGIIYVDRKTYEIHFLEIEEERETKESLDRDYTGKFLFEYIRADRYIGIYSIQNQRIFEVDTVLLCVKYIEYEISNETILTLAKDIGLYDDGKIFFEKRKGQSIFFSALLKRKHEIGDTPIKNIGKQIYQMLDEL